MELLMKNIHMCRQAKQAEIQVTLDEDLNVPDVNPDVEMIVQSRERVVLEHTRVEAGKLHIDGFMAVSILYMDDTKERRLHRLEMKLPFDEVLHMENLELGDSVNLHHETEDLTVSLINSRKLAVRALVSFSADVDEIYDLSAAVETQSEIMLCERRKKLELIQLEVQKKDIYRLKEEVQISSNKPNISEILWDNTQLRSCRVSLSEGQLDIQGKLFLFIMYRGEDESQSVQWMEQIIPFEGKLDCSGCRVGQVPDVEVTLSQMEVTPKADTDGEMRIFHLEGMLNLDIRVYDSEEAEILEDIFSPEKDLELTASEELYESLVMKNESKCRAGGKIRIQGAKPRILQICHSTGSIKIDSARIQEGGIRIEGAVPVSILYISSDDTMPFALMEGTIPFTHVAEAPDVTPDCRFTLRAGMEQLSATMSDSEEIEVKVTAVLNLLIVRPQKQKCIHAVEEKDYELEQLEKIPGITAYIVQGEEQLWDIAKEYYMTPRQIVEMNGLESEQVSRGDCLILMKTVTPGTAE